MSEFNTNGPIDIWDIAQQLQRDGLDDISIRFQDGEFETWDDIAAISKQAMDPIMRVETFLNEVYGVTGLFRENLRPWPLPRM